MASSGNEDPGFSDSEENFEGDLADDFLKTDLPKRMEGEGRSVGRSVGDKTPKRRVRSRSSGVGDNRVQTALPGADPIIGSNVEEVWDDDPAMPEVPEEALEEEGETLSTETTQRVKKIKKRDAEQRWGWGQKTTLWWLASGVSAILVVGYILQQNDKARSTPAVVEEPERFVSSISLGETPVSQLLIFGQSAVSELVETMQKIERAPEKSADLLAGGEKTIPKIRAWQNKMGEKAKVKEDGVIGLMAAGQRDRGYLLMSGLRDDYSQYIAYFVEVGGKLLLDWEATEGFSEMLPEELVTLNPEQSVELRAVVSASSFYTDIFPEEIYACVLLSHVDRESYAWGYTRRDTPEYDRLLDALNSPVAALTAGRVILKVKGSSGGGLPKQVLVSKVVATDWLRVPIVSQDEGASESEESGK